MGYSAYKKLKTVTKKFGLDARLERLFTDDIAVVQPSAWLVQSLTYAKVMPLTNEKNKSERLVSPILLEISIAFQKHITLFSGEELSVSPEENLSGECDFFFALHPPKPYIDLPIISLVEAKDEDLDWGLGQCAAQVYGAHRFNIAEGNEMPVLYGCATTGIEWQFLRFENDTFYVDTNVLTDLPTVIGTWHWILNYYINNFKK